MLDRLSTAALAIRPWQGIRRLGASRHQRIQTHLDRHAGNPYWASLECDGVESVRMWVEDADVADRTAGPDAQGVVQLEAENRAGVGDRRCQPSRR